MTNTGNQPYDCWHPAQGCIARLPALRMKLPVVAKSGAAGPRQPSTVAGNGCSVTTDVTSRIGHFRDQPNPDLQSIRIIQILV